MTRHFRSFPLLLLGLACAWPSAAQSENTKNTGYLDGHWEGVLKVAAAGTRAAYDLAMRLDIEGDKIEVQNLQGDGKWMHILPGQFKLHTNNFNAVAVGMHRSQGDCWDESWVFNVALDNSNQLRTHWSRVVDNIRCLKADSETFSQWADGTLKRDGEAK